MFKDYYLILDINLDATQDEVKQAYKRMAIKWHPDKNPNVDTTQQMQDINEAYIILNDMEARERYNAEYLKFRQSKQKSTYVVEDEVLNNWIKNASNQAAKIVQEVMDEFKGATKSGLNSIAKGFMYFVLPWLLGYLLIRGCR